jgi:hypothetical protein
MALSRLDPCVDTLTRGPTCPVREAGQPHRRRGHGWRSLLKSRELRRRRDEPWVGGIDGNHPRFRSPSDFSCVFCQCLVRRSVVGFHVTPRFVWRTPRGAHGKARWNRCCMVWGRLAFAPTPGEIPTKGPTATGGTRQQEDGGPCPTAAWTPKREIGCAEPRTRLRGTKRGRGVAFLVTRRDSASLRRTSDESHGSRGDGRGHGVMGDVAAVLTLFAPYRSSTLSRTLRVTRRRASEPGVRTTLGKKPVALRNASTYTILPTNQSFLP